MHFPFFLTHLGDTHWQPSTAGFWPTAHVGGVGEGIGEILGNGVGVGIVTGVGVGVGVGLGFGVDDVSGSQTDNIGLTE